ncbi:hypothetical protein QBC37DRAFT_399017 [Rhypophila decipiens]|uniref:Secreted protein n=1 Tax=Rhypophila decipiens TaxID=261697 RepID=A0AAN6YEF9_9PEZI|nr:hypothetical protein QBC37DRAFT_399017 [Rhypophila decipiens]
MSAVGHLGLMYLMFCSTTAVSPLPFAMGRILIKFKVMENRTGTKEHILTRSRIGDKTARKWGATCESPMIHLQQTEPIVHALEWREQERVGWKIPKNQTQIPHKLGTEESRVKWDNLASA